MANQQRSQIPPETPLPACPELAVGFTLPVPISHRLDLLVELVETEAGERTSRKELLAALILAAGDDGKELARSLRIYRSQTAASVLTPGAELEQGLALRPGRPGPRRRRWKGA